MRATKHPRVKICCISSREEARLAIDCGASAVGLVSAMPSGPGVISEELITDIAASIPPPIATFLLTSKQDAESIIAQQRRCRINTIQIVDRFLGSYEALKVALPGISIVQVVHVTGEESVEEAIAVAAHVDALLLDSGNPMLATKELGGTGRRHNWALSQRIRERIGIPIFLAGGLKPDNVHEAVREVGPFGLDVCTGVRGEGKLDEQKLRALFESLAKPLDSLGPNQ
ncbi:MAG TPA: phosphoribosylanthranilate isomerase [Candidatus Deferrimicrobiaceae bacterium]|nr:phosphoribosylanthranilate isomerase [Candidatus Deferrimicrobiaceae bacterium]